MKKLILIDTTFFCFYRYGATCVWYSRHTKQGNKDSCNIENKEFVQYYDIQFRNTVNKILKHFDTENIVWLLDCPKSEVWRNFETTGYKANREGIPGISDFIKHTYDNILIDYKKMGINTAEADDCIAVITKYEYANSIGCIDSMDNVDNIYIISGDSDLWQLCNEKVSVINPINNSSLKKSEICIKFGKVKKNFTADRYLKMKVLIGDKTDKISPVFTGCGPAMALKLIDNTELFEKTVMSDAKRKANYEKNRLLIDLSYIPDKLQTIIIEKYLEITDKLN